MVETWYKVTIEATEYTDRFIDIQVIGRESDVASAILIADNKAGEFWTDTVDVFDDISIQIRAVTHGTPQGGTLQSVFTGTVREVKPYANMGGFYTALKCKGLGAALEETHCKDEFGYTSKQHSLNTVEEILEDLVDNSINKSYSSANNTGYTITKTYIPTIDAGLSIPFFNAPYQTCKSIANLICTLNTAYRDGGTAGPHWFVDTSGNLRVKTIGTQQVDGGGGGGDWGKYYNGQATAVDAHLYEDEDFYEYTLTKPSDQYANSVVLAFDLRKPAYDHICESGTSGGAALWTNDALTSITNDSTAGPPAHFIVGTDAVKFDPNGAVQGYGYYPNAAANWDTSKWGSEITIPTINFYCWKHLLTAATTFIYMSTNDTARKTDFYYTPFMNWGENDDQWYHKSIPIGPYWASSQETREFRWSNAGTPSWTNIDTVEFAIAGGGENGYLLIDDLHFSGKCIREAVALGGESDPDPHPNNQHQHVIFSRTPLDDTAIAADDTGLAGQLCHAELLRRVAPPRMFTCTVPFKHALKPGEYFTLHAGKTSAGTYKVDGVDFRTVQYTHRVTQGMRPQTSLVLTDDVLNSFPLGAVDARGVLNEYLLENNAKATDMQGGDVDLLIPHLRKTY